MLRRSQVPFAELTSLRVGGPAATLLEPVTSQELHRAVAGADDEGVPLLVVGGGTNLVVADDGYPGVVVRVGTRGCRRERDGDELVVTVAAGEPLDDLVASAVEDGWSGLETLSGVPGTVGAAPVQNVGAYGREIGPLVRAVRVLDRALGQVRDLSRAQCRFGYRTSALKGNDRFVVLSVTVALARGPAQPVRYAELARTLDVPLGACPPLAQVRAAVLALRAAKGMLAPLPIAVGADSADSVDSVESDNAERPASAGSFFTNPLLAASVAGQLPPEVPRWPAPHGKVKIPAAWLIEHAGFSRGYGRGPVRLSPRHALAIINTGGARTEQVLSLAREVRDGVATRFGVRLLPEPALIGCQL